MICNRTAPRTGCARVHGTLWVSLALAANTSCTLTAISDEALSGGSKDRAVLVDGAIDAGAVDRRASDAASALDRAPGDAASDAAAEPDRAGGSDANTGSDATTPRDASVADQRQPDSAVADAGPFTPGALSCSSSSTLELLVACILTHMPADGSGIFVAPSTAERADWKIAVGQMLTGSCSHALPANLTGIAERYTLVDADTHKPYCVLTEAGDSNSNGLVDKGWGTVIVDAAATRELSQQMAEPLNHNADMEAAAVTVFKRTDSRSFVMPGTARAASNTNSTCQAGLKISDALHNDNTMFQATAEALLAHYGSNQFNVLQYDANTDCTNYDVYLSHGSATAAVSTDPIRVLRGNLRAAHSTWDVQAVGTASCSEMALGNVQGRLLNGVAASSVCNTNATSYSGHYLWIAQKLAMRTAADWIVPIQQTWP